MAYYVQITFDTEGIKREYTNPSLDPENPTEIEESYCYMVASSKHLTGSNTRQLELIRTAMYPTIRFYGTSASNNFEDSALIYSVNRQSTHSSSKQYDPISLENSAISPSIPDTLPAQTNEGEAFYFQELEAWFKGKKEHKISFAVYGRDNRGQPLLYGYFMYRAIFRLHWMP